MSPHPKPTCNSSLGDKNGLASSILHRQASDTDASAERAHVRHPHESCPGSSSVDVPRKVDAAVHRRRHGSSARGEPKNVATSVVSNASGRPSGNKTDSKKERVGGSGLLKCLLTINDSIFEGEENEQINHVGSNRSNNASASARGNGDWTTSSAAESGLDNARGNSGGLLHPNSAFHPRRKEMHPLWLADEIVHGLDDISDNEYEDED